MATAEQRMASQMKQMTRKAEKRVSLSEAVKKIGVRSAFGVTAVDLHRHERQGKK